jgi:integrase
MSKRRRTKGSGSIYTRKDGRVVGEYEVNGKAKYIYGRDEDTVREKLAEAIRNRDAGFDTQNLTTAEYLDRWLNAIRGTIRPGSWKQYEMISRIHLKPALGRTKLEKLNALQVQNLYQVKLDSGLSPRRVRYIHTTVHKALKDAVKWRIVPHNVAEACTPPKQITKEINPLTAAQMKKLLAAARETQPKLYALYTLACTTGMRQGELLGLQRKDIDLAAGTIKIRRTIFNNEVNPPKSANGRRTIKLSKLALNALTNHLEHYAGVTWVFSTRNQTPINAWNLYHKSWRPLLERTGLPSSTRFHDMRHSCATLLLLKGINARMVSNILGHGDVGFTLNVYGHVLQEMEDQAADSIDDTLS